MEVDSFDFSRRRRPRGRRRTPTAASGEIAEFVREKLQKPKIVLVGLSRGSILGVFGPRRPA
jgi:hypothetical protein